MATDIGGNTSIRQYGRKTDQFEWARRHLPGVALCVIVTIAAYGLEHLELQLFGRAWLEALVIAILLGTIVRSVWTPSMIWAPGINFSAKTLLEIAIVLLGASLSSRTLQAAGGGLLVGIIAVVSVAIAISYFVCRLFGLHHRMALLVACGNSICGNSAIAAVAPVIDAHSDDVAASIAFTAVFGVVVVLVLPLLVPLLRLSDLQYGALAGLTVYAVPQVLAATVPISTTSAHLGMLVKLIRVLMLGPVIVAISIGPRIFGKKSASDNVQATDKKKTSWHTILPWFIIGFLFLVAARSMDVIPTCALQPLSHIATLLTIVSMAALGLGVDVRTVAKAGLRVTMSVVISITLLGCISLGLIYALNMH